MYTCPFCGKNYKSRSGLWAHKKRLHSDAPSIPDTKPDITVLDNSNPMPHRKIQVCDNCPALPWCQRLIKAGYILCELVDQDQLKGYQTNGVDLNIVITDQRLRHQLQVLVKEWYKR